MDGTRVEVFDGDGGGGVEVGVVDGVFGGEGGEEEELRGGGDGVEPEEVEGQKGGHGGLVVVSGESCRGWGEISVELREKGMGLAQGTKWGDALMSKLSKTIWRMRSTD